MTIDQKIADIYASSKAELWSALAPKMATNKRYGADKRTCLAWLKGDESVFVLYEGSNSQIKSVLMASSFPDVAGPTIIVFFLYHSGNLTKAMVRNWIEALTDRYQNINRLLIQATDQQVELKKVLKGMGAKIDSFELIGPTYIPDFNTTPTFPVRLVEADFNFHPLLKIEKLAHESDTSSRAYGHTNQLKKQTIGLLEVCRKKGLFSSHFIKTDPSVF